MGALDFFSHRNSNAFIIVSNAIPGKSTSGNGRFVTLRSCLLCAVAAAFLSVDESNADPIPRNKIISFEVPGSTQTWPEDINNNLTIVGVSHGSQRASFVYRNGIRETTSSEYTYHGNNDQGQIVGSLRQPGPSGSLSVGFIKSGSEITEIPAPDFNGIFPQDINNHGTIVGRFGDWRAFVLTEEGLIPIFEEWEEQEDESGIRSSEARAINDEGVIVGRYTDNEGNSLGFIYDGGLHSVEFPDAEITALTGINNWGLTVGYHSSGDETSRGFAYYDERFIPIEVGELSTLVSAINDWGFITGRYRDSWETGEQAFVAHILQFIVWEQLMRSYSPET